MDTLTPVRADPHPPRPAAPAFAPAAADLEEVERVLARALSSDAPAVARLVEHLAHYRGKRLRPLLLLLAARACGRVTPQHHTLAAAVEMVHTATLVHDDVLDGAQTRRHARTVNAAWGNQTSILLGDLLFARALLLTAQVDLEACRVIGSATDRVCAGELLQISHRGDLGLDEATYFAIIDGKTAELTACCTRLGSLYAGAAPEVVERLAAYGRFLGQAFQVADDLLDLVGEERTAGKTLGTDLEQQKLTLPLIHLLDRLPAAEADAVRHLLRAPGPRQREQLQPYLARTGSIGYARRRAEELAAKARAALDVLPASESRSVLAQLTDWAIRREN
jgi:octaprenyl-diphosphate synthase